eukprot:gene20462-27251_t
MHVWRDQIIDFMDEFIDSPVILIGNSFGSFACLMVNVALPQERVKGTVLLNCAGAMNNKGLAGDDWRIALLYPILLLFDLLLKTPVIASYLFKTFSTPEAIRNVLTQSFYGPSCDEGALDVFVSVLTGPPGPRLNDVVEGVKGPLLVLWGDKDIFTPLDGPSGAVFKALPGKRPDTIFELLEGTGHCVLFKALPEKRPGTSFELLEGTGDCTYTIRMVSLPEGEEDDVVHLLMMDDNTMLELLVTHVDIDDVPPGSPTIEKVIYNEPGSYDVNLEQYLDECSYGKARMDRSNSRVVGPVVIPCDNNDPLLSFTTSDCTFSDANSWHKYAQQYVVEDILVLDLSKESFWVHL